MRTPEIGIPISAVLSIGSGPLGHPIDPLGATGATHPRVVFLKIQKKEEKRRPPLELSGPDLHKFLFVLPPTIVARLSGSNKGVRLLPACRDADKTTLGPA